jgi:hypothetical protein
MWTPTEVSAYNSPQVNSDGLIYDELPDVTNPVRNGVEHLVHSENCAKNVQ